MVVLLEPLTAIEIKWAWKLKVVLLIGILNRVQSQTFIRDCADPILLENHMDRTYCAHACGYNALGLPDASTCNTDGNCICNFPCDATGIMLSEICPIITDPPDPDPDGPQNCDDACQVVCPGSGSVACGNNIPQGADGMTFSKICTCYCMPMPCTTTTTTTTISPLPTTTTISSAIGVFPGSNNLPSNFIGLISGSVALSAVKGSLFKFVLKTLLILSRILNKIGAIYLVKSALVAAYSIVLYTWFEYQYGILFELLRTPFQNIAGQIISSDSQDQ